MADHIAKQVVDAVAAMIVAAGTSLDDRVYVGRVTQPTKEQLPCALVDIVGESIEMMGASMPHQQQRTVGIDVAILVRDLNGYDAVAFLALKEVEHVIAADHTAQSKVRMLRPVSVRWERDNAGDQPVVRATLSCEAFAFVRNNAVDAAI